MKTKYKQALSQILKTGKLEYPLEDQGIITDAIVTITVHAITKFEPDFKTHILPGKYFFTVEADWIMHDFSGPVQAYDIEEMTSFDKAVECALDMVDNIKKKSTMRPPLDDLKAVTDQYKVVVTP